MKNILNNSSVVILCILFTMVSKAQNNWQPLNGPSGGPVYGVITGNPSFDFCISPSGIYRTSNNGDLWSQSNPSSIKDLYIGSAGINGYIYAATTNYTTLLYRSSDNGNSWEQRLDGGLDFNALAVSPNGTIFAGTFYMFSFHGQFIQDGEIFRSNDNGNTWIPLNFPPLAINSLKINSNNEVFVGTTEGLFRSANNGGSFGLIRSGSVGTIFINSQNHIFISTTGYTILRSTDNGSTWVTLSTDPEVKMPLAEDGSGNLYTGYNGKLYKSIDNGSSWNLFAELSQNSFYEVTSIIFKPGNKIIASTSNGIFRSDNNGASWSEANTGIRDPRVTSMSIKTNTIFTASMSSVSRSTDNGNSWDIIDNGLPNSVARIIEGGSAQNVFVYMPAHGLYRSVNNGNFWFRVQNLPAGTGISHLKARGDNKLYVTTDDGEIFKSDNNGDSWINITNDLPDSIMFSGFNVDQQNNLYASVQRSSWIDPLKGIYRSTNDGASWNVINSDFAPEDLTFNSQGIFFIKFGNALLRSDNGGTTFSQLTTLQEYVIEFTVGRSDQLIVYLAENEIYEVKKSLDNGVTWTDITGILNNQFVYDLKIDSDARVLAATQSGVYRSSSPTAINILKNYLPNGFLLKQNYPNPFNPVTNLEFEILNSGFVSLKVYDILGNEVAALVNEKKYPGTYKVNFNARSYGGSNLPSGVYYYKLTIGSSPEETDFSETKKMILIK